MLRRTFLFSAGLPVAVSLAGCRGQRQFARIVNPGDKALMGSHQAGAETFGPLVDEAVAKLLARNAETPVQQVSYDDAGEPLPCEPKRICFVGVENKSAEDIGDFKDELYQVIDARLLQTPVFQPLNRRVVDAGLLETRLRPRKTAIR